MSQHLHSVRLWAAVASAAFLWAASGFQAAAAGAAKVRCDGLQAAIDQAADGATLEIKGICEGNILIRGKALTLKGAASPGQHGIKGTAANTDAVRIENSRGTHLEGLTISNPLAAGVRILYSSDVTMTDCTVNESGGGTATAIWVHDHSYFAGLRLRLEDNLRGLGATQSSGAWCTDCDLLNNGAPRAGVSAGGWAASSRNNSMVTLLDSAVSGVRGLDARNGSYIDIDCASQVPHSGHACSLTVTGIAGLASAQSTVLFYDAGDFTGALVARDRSVAELYGARQGGDPKTNSVDTGSSLRVGPGDTGNSRLQGHTDVTGFSHALIYHNTVLEGSLTCDQGGDAWVDPGISLTSPGFTFTGCAHAPAP